MAGSAEQCTISALLADAVASRGDAEAVVDGEVRVTYRELDERVARTVHTLTKRGISGGSRMVALMRDGLAFIELLLASARMGAVLCPLNWRLNAAELAFQVGDLEPAIGICSDRYASLAQAASDALPWLGSADLPGAAKADTSCDARRVSTADDPLLILYTSGTTGWPKGAVHSQACLYAGAVGWASHRNMVASDRTLMSAPLFHVAGLSSVLATLAVGGCAVMAPQPLVIDELIRLLRDERCTVWSYHPTLTIPLLERIEAGEAGIRLRSMTMGASIHPPETARRVRDMLGPTITFGYGQTEIGGFGAACDLEVQQRYPDAWGWPLPFLSARVLDDAGNDVTTEKAGELCLRGTSVMLGYWRNEAATKEVFVDGWLRTGDVCTSDANGMLRFAGRKKELVKTGGENVYPLEVERVLCRHPAIADCCVVGVPDARWGEAVKAFVVLVDDATVECRELSEWCKREIAGYKRPRYIEFIDEIPRDFQRKPLRARLSALPVTPEQATG